MARLDVNVKETGIDQTSKKIKQLDKDIKTTDKSSKEYTKTNKDMGKSLKDVGIAVAGVYASFKSLDTVYNGVIKNGIQYQSLLEDQLAGLTALRVATTKNIDAQGKALTLEQKYIIAQKESIATLKELQLINERTPQQLLETLELYKVLVPTLGRAGASQMELFKVTELLAKASANYGLGFQQLIAGVDGLATGTVLAASDLGKFLVPLGLSNEKLRETSNVAQLLIDKLSPLGKDLDTLTVRTSNLANAWNELGKRITEPIYDDVKDAVLSLTTAINSIDNQDIDRIANVAEEMAKIGLAIGTTVVTVKTYNALVKTSIALNVAYGGSFNALNAKILTATATTKAFNAVMRATPIGLVTAGIYGLIEAYDNYNDNLERNKEIQDQINKGKFDRAKDLSELSKQEKMLRLEQQITKVAQLRYDISTNTNLTEEQRKRIIDSQTKSLDNLVKKYLVIQKGQAESVGGLVNDSKKVIEEEINSVLSTSLSSWANYYEQIGDYSTSWGIREAELRTEYIDLTEEQFKRLSDIAKTEYFDKIKEESEKAMNELVEDFEKFEIEFKFEGLSDTSKALHSITDVFEDINKEQKKFDKAWKATAGDRKKQAQLEEKHLNNQIKMYGNLSGAMSTLFDEGSREAAAFQAIESGIALVTGVRAILTQGSGDPYTAFARIAAMTATVSSLLSSVNIAFGGGRTSVSSDAFSAMEANTGTGSVLGDVTAQSESIENSLEILEDFAEPQYQVLQSMNNYLRNISFALGGVSSLLVQQGGFAFGEGFSPFSSESQKLTTSKLGLDNFTKILDKLTFGNSLVGGIINSVLGGLFGKTSVTQNLYDSGIFFANQLLTSAIEDFNGAAYQTIQTIIRKKSWFSSSTSISYNTYFQSLSEETERQFSLVLGNLYNTTIEAGKALDTSTQDVEQRLSNFVVSIGKISLKGKSGDQIQETLTAIFGRIGDDIAKTAFPALRPFQQVGEGMFETLTRVARGMEEAEYYINRLGVAFDDISYTDVINTQGDVGFEALRQVIVSTDEELFGVNNNLVKMINNLNSTAEELFNAYTALDELRDRLIFIGRDANGLSSAMITGAGGLESLQSGFSDYFDNFLDDEEKRLFFLDQLNQQFEALGVSTPNTKDQFRALLESIDLTTEEGQELYGGLITLSGAYAEATEAQDNYLKSIRSTIDALSDLGTPEQTQFQQLSRFNRLVSDFGTNQSQDTLNQILSLGRTLGQDETLTASIIASLTSISSSIASTGLGFATGGYTGNGGKYDIAGVVHKGEYVVNQEQLRYNGGVAGVMQKLSNGGSVSNEQMTQLLSSVLVELQDQNRLLRNVTNGGTAMATELIA